MNNKGFVHIAVIVLVVVIVGTGIYLAMSRKSETEPVTNSVPTQTPTSTQSRFQHKRQAPTSTQSPAFETATIIFPKHNQILNAGETFEITLDNPISFAGGIYLFNEGGKYVGIINCNKGWEDPADKYRWHVGGVVNICGAAAFGKAKLIEPGRYKIAFELAPSIDANGRVIESSLKRLAESDSFTIADPQRKYEKLSNQCRDGKPNETCCTYSNFVPLQVCEDWWNSTHPLQ